MKEIAEQSLNCFFEGVQRTKVNEFTFEHKFTPNTGACVYACTVYFGDEIGYCCTYDWGFYNFVEAALDALKQVKPN